MKKLPLVFAFAVALVMGLTSCLSTASSTSSTSSSSSTITIKMYVNEPTDDLYAEAAVLAIKLTNNSFDGMVSFSYQGTPNSTSVGPIATYYGYCEGIKAAIAKGHGKDCKLSFNTMADGSGTTLDFSSTSTILTSLLTMAVYNYTTVYAIYKF